MRAGMPLIAHQRYAVYELLQTTYMDRGAVRSEAVLLLRPAEAKPLIYSFVKVIRL